MTNTWLSVRSSVVLFIFVMMGLGEHSTTANMDEVKALLSQMSADLQSVKTQLQETRQELKNEMQSYEAKLQNTRQELKNDIESTEMKLQNSHDKLKRDFQAADTQLQNSHDKLKRDFQAADTQLQKTRQELRADLESSDTRLQRTCRELRTDLGFAETELRKLRHDLRFAETNQSNTMRRLLRRLPRAASTPRNLWGFTATGWDNDYDPGQTLVYYWIIHNNKADIMDPTGNFKPPATGLYIVAFSGTIAPASPKKKNVYATMVVGSDDVAYAYAAYDDHYETGSMQVVRKIPKGTPVYIQNDKYHTVRWDRFVFCAVFITE